MSNFITLSRVFYLHIGRLMFILVGAVLPLEVHFYALEHLYAQFASQSWLFLFTVLPVLGQGWVVLSEFPLLPSPYIGFEVPSDRQLCIACSAYVLSACYIKGFPPSLPVVAVQPLEVHVYAFEHLYAWFAS